MSVQERRYVIGLAWVVLAVAAYLTVVTVRALTDGLPLAEVAWQGPLLVALVAGGLAYGASYGTMRWLARGERSSDERDARIERAALAAGGGLASLAVLVSLVMLALEASTFWVAQVLFVGSALGSMVESATALAAYRGEVDA